jgi:hypothetical protein
MKIGRNDPCFCGSGKKYKKCCLGRELPEEFKRRDHDILPDRWEIDYGAPRLEKDFFDRNELAEFSAARMIQTAMLFPEAIEEVASQVRLETGRYLAELQEVKGLAGPEDIVRFLKKGPDRLNYPQVRDKFLEYDQETAPLLLEEMRTANDEKFVEWSVKLFYESDHVSAEDILELVELHQHDAYALSLLCVLLGFFEHPAIPKVLWDYFHYFKNHFRDELYYEGPLLALREIVDYQEEGAGDEDVPTTRDEQEIIARMKAIGLPMDKETFLRDIQGVHSAQKLVDRWIEKYPVLPDGRDEDFLWFGAMELWKRWAPEVMFDEGLSDMIQRGYDLFKEKEDREGCDLWLDVWGHFKARYAGHVRSVEEADKDFHGSQSWHNWSQDLEMELGNLVRHCPDQAPRAVAYFREFQLLLPDSSSLIVQNMMMAEADALICGGDLSAGEDVFRKVVASFPDDVWGYIRWGDVFASFWPSSSVPQDLVKAEQIYRMALGRGLKEEKEVKRRIKDMGKAVKTKS